MLDEALAQSQARLLVLDPVMAFLEAGVVTSSDQGVRRALLPLAQLAEKHACAVLLVRHLNKQGGRRALYRGGGSIGLLAACRSGWLLAEDPQEARRRVLAQVKNNLAPPPSLALEVRPRLAKGEQHGALAFRVGAHCRLPFGNCLRRRGEPGDSSLKV
jgi:AAA domain